MATTVSSLSPAPLTISHLATSSPPLPRAEEADQDQTADASAISVPYTPTSSVPSGSASISPSPSPRQSSQTHRTANSTSNPAPVKEVNALFPKRPLSLQDKTQLSEVNTLVEEKTSMPRAEDQQRLLGLKLPPSPPLTNREVDGDPESEAAAAAAERELSDSTHNDGNAAQVVVLEHDITEAWRGTTQGPIPSSSARASHDDVPRPRTISALSSSLSHPLANSNPGPSSSHADIDLERGPDSLQPTPTPMGVTKPFEIIRSAQRFSTPQPPKSSYYLGPPVGPTAYGTPPVGQLGVHHPREIIRVERDYDNGELVQFSSAYPLELQGRITPTQFLETINALNEGLIRAHSLSGAMVYNILAILTLWLSPLFLQSRYEKEMEKLKFLVDVLNGEVYNPVGLNILWPRRNAFLFLEIEYY